MIKIVCEERWETEHPPERYRYFWKVVLSVDTWWVDLQDEPLGKPSEHVLFQGECATAAAAEEKAGEALLRVVANLKQISIGPIR